MEHILTTWLLTYAAHGAMFTALAFVAERTRWGAVASRRDATAPQQVRSATAASAAKSALCTAYVRSQVVTMWSVISGVPEEACRVPDAADRRLPHA